MPGHNGHRKTGLHLREDKALLKADIVSNTYSASLGERVFEEKSAAIKAGQAKRKLRLQANRYPRRETDSAV